MKSEPASQWASSVYRMPTIGPPKALVKAVCGAPEWVAEGVRGKGFVVGRRNGCKRGQEDCKIGYFHSFFFIIQPPLATGSLDPVPLHHWHWYLQGPGIFLPCLFYLNLTGGNSQSRSLFFLLPVVSIWAQLAREPGKRSFQTLSPILQPNTEGQMGLQDNRQITRQGPDSNTICFLTYFLILCPSLPFYHPQLKETSPSSEFCVNLDCLWLNVKYN